MHRLRVRVLLLLLSSASAAFAETYSPTIPDVAVTTHEGKSVRFYTDLVKGKTVAVNFIFTNCSTICPASGALFAGLQKQNERGVHFISVSIDPAVDTPKKLKAWSAQFRTGPSWTLVTGTQEAIDQLIKALGGPAGRPQDHMPLTLVGNDATRTWTRLYGFPGAEKLDALVTEVSSR